MKWNYYVVLLGVCASFVMGWAGDHRGPGGQSPSNHRKFIKDQQDERSRRKRDKKALRLIELRDAIKRGEFPPASLETPIAPSPSSASVSNPASGQAYKSQGLSPRKTPPGKGKRGFRSFGEMRDGQANLVEAFLTSELKVEDPSLYLVNLQFFNSVVQPQHRASTLAEINPSQLSAEGRESFLNLFPDSDRFREIANRYHRSLGLTEYNNAFITAPPGVGKTTVLRLLVSIYGFGIFPDSYKTHLGILDDEPQVGKNLREAYIGKVNFVKIDKSLFSHDLQRRGNQAIPDSPSRSAIILAKLFKAAEDEYHRTDVLGNRIGSRTVFVMEEAATLEKAIQDAIKTYTDLTGFQKTDITPRAGRKDPGFTVLCATTEKEYIELASGDSAIDRRYVRIKILEPAEEETLQILKTKWNQEWFDLTELQVEPEALEYLVKMRKMLHEPPLPMPAGVIQAANDFLNWRSTHPGKKPGVATLEDAQIYVLKERALLPSIWWERGPNGEPPFWNLAEQIKQRVKGQDHVVDQISKVLVAWARYGFGEEVPIFILGGPPESGKNTLVEAISMVMFGHPSIHTTYSAVALGEFGISSILSGPPVGNHSDKVPPRLLTDRRNGPPQSILAIDEVKNAQQGQIDFLKTILNQGRLSPAGVDGREVHLSQPIFLMGQMGEELFKGRPTQESLEIARRLGANDVQQIFVGTEENPGPISAALFTRAERTGGNFILGPVDPRYFVDISAIEAKKVVEQFARKSIQVNPSNHIVQYAADLAALEARGPRTIYSRIVELIRISISLAADQGMPDKNVAIEIDLISEKNGSADRVIVLKQGDQSWFVPFEEVNRRVKCGEDLDPIGP